MKRNLLPNGATGARPARASTWRWEQELSLRPSTLILVYVLLLFAAGIVDTVNGLPEPLETLLQIAGWSSGWLLLAAAALAAAYFVGSLLARNPQLQFLVELLVALGTYAAVPSY